MRHNQHIDLTPAHALHQAETYRCNVRLPSEEELCKQQVDNAIEVVAWLVFLGCIFTFLLVVWAAGNAVPS